MMPCGAGWWAVERDGTSGRGLGGGGGGDGEMGKLILINTAGTMLLCKIFYVRLIDSSELRDEWPYVLLSSIRFLRLGRGLIDKVRKRPVTDTNQRLESNTEITK
jgi:hypothetical protein